MRPDVTLVSPYPRLGTVHDGYSGVASYSGHLAHALADDGLRVTVVAPVEDGEPASGQDGPVHVLRTFSRGPGAVPAALRAAHATAAGVVHLQFELFLYAGAAGLPLTVAALLRHRSGAAPTVVTMHQVVAPAGVSRAYTRMHRVAAPPWAARLAIAGVQRALPAAADAVVVHEPAFARSVPGAVVIRHGTEVVAPSDEATWQVRDRLGLPKDALVALCFGFLAPYKGLETALEAAELLGRQVCLVVAGGPHPRLAERGDDYADQLVHRWGQVARFTGYVPDHEVGAWFRAADVALFCYPQPHASSGPLALALAHGTPVLMSDRLAATVSAPTETAVPPGSPALAHRLARLAVDPEELSRVAAASSRMATGRSWPTVARRHMDLYEVPVVAVVTVDSRLFTGTHERNQRWVDGALFAMSLVWALHGLGLSTCMLNWSMNNAASNRLRAAAGLPEHEDVVVLLALGYAATGCRVARSPRRDLDQVLDLR